MSGPLPLRRLATIVLGAVAVLAAAGTLGVGTTLGADAPSGPTTSTTPVTVADARPRDRESSPTEIAAVTRAHHSAYQAFATVLISRDPEHPDLARHYALDAGEGLLDVVSNDLANDHGTLMPADPAAYGTRVLGVDIEGQRAEVRACDVDGLILYDRSTGEVIDARIVWSIDTWHYRRMDGSWKVIEVDPGPVTEATLDEATAACRAA